jgi:GTP-binding protein YchF
MQAGIIGLPQSGKSAVFCALTGLPAGAESGRKARLVRGVVKVPDPRLEVLARQFRPRKVTQAEIVFTDLPGPGPGDEAGRRSIARSFLGEMRTMDLLVHVVRTFEHPALGRTSPLEDLRALHDEMIIADLEVLEHRMTRLAKGEKQSFPGETGHLQSIHEALSDGRTVRSLDLTREVLASLQGYAFLTLKPEVVVLNRDDSEAGVPVPREVEVAALTQARAVVALCARLETELAEIDPHERGAFMQEMGIETAGTELFVREVYDALGLISFFTGGDPEVRAWTVRAGTTALRAAGKIHTDMERGFIKAEVTPFETFAAGGRPTQVGRDHVIEDGDVLLVKFNV